MSRMADHWQGWAAELSRLWDEAYRICDKLTIPRTKAYMLFYRAYRYDMRDFAGSFDDAVQALEDAAPGVAEHLGIPIPAPPLRYGDRGDCLLAWRAYIARLIRRDRVAQLAEPVWTGKAVLEILDAIEAGQMPEGDP